MGSATARADLEAMCRDGQGVVKDSFDIPQHLQDVAGDGVVEAYYNLDDACKSEEVDCQTSVMSPEEIRSASLECFRSYANK
ncbi:hypothetical protein [Helicobacter bizzozeronii]|uniref:hypothetical protein n=1 Tax=Helicobacter bizzozeronii TaxID=56877 RepID=UPI0013159BD9|nr:hypothetical protein [Helicobacter bizzozeronii]